MSLAAETRDAVAEQPFLVSALRAGIVNYTAAARFLEIDGEHEAIAAALRRYADDLTNFESQSRAVRVTMQSGLEIVESPTAEEGEFEPLFCVGGIAITETSGSGSCTGILAAGDVDAATLSVVLDSLAFEDIPVTAAGVGGECMIVVVDRLDGANAVRAVERAVENVPNRPTV